MSGPQFIVVELETLRRGPGNGILFVILQRILGHESMHEYLARQVRWFSQDLTSLVAELGRESRSPHPVCALSHTAHQFSFSPVARGITCTFPLGKGSSRWPTNPRDTSVQAPWEFSWSYLWKWSNLGCFSRKGYYEQGPLGNCL